MDILWINPPDVTDVTSKSVGRLPAGKPLWHKAFSDFHRVVENALVPSKSTRMGARPQIGVKSLRSQNRGVSGNFGLSTTSVVSGGVERLFV